MLTPTIPKRNPSTTQSQIMVHFREILRLIGEDPDRPGLVSTPHRAAEALQYFTSGYQGTAKTLAQKALFEESSQGQVMVKNIEFFSLCEHHLVPFFGVCSVAYIPKGRIIGISKIARIVDLFARRLQVQERLCFQVCSELESLLAPQGVAVRMEASHLCMLMRGVQKSQAKTSTTCFKGVFETEASLRAEFLSTCC